MFDHYDDSLDQTQEWEYDLVGNRTLQKLDKGNDHVWDAVTKYSYDENDRLLEEMFDGQNDGVFEKKTLYDYDHTQQTSKIVTENGIKLNETEFKYDAQGRMSVVTITIFNENDAKTRIERTAYEYGADGIRVSVLHEIDEDGNGTFDTSKLTEYLNDPLNITGYSQVLKQTETDLQTGDVTSIIYVIGHQRISQIVTDKDSNQQEYYFTFDGHGSTRALTDFAGAIVQLYSFDAYGNAIGFNPAEALTEFLYSGEQFDSKIGQQYLRARYYDPVTGRFNRLDPFFGNVSDPQSFHKYLYTHADPVNGIDPIGESLMSVGIGMVSGMARSIGSTIAAFGVQRYVTIIAASIAVGSIFGAVDTMLNREVTTLSDVIKGGIYGAVGGLVVGVLGPFIHPAVILCIGLPLSGLGIYDSHINGNTEQEIFRLITGPITTIFAWKGFNLQALRVRVLGKLQQLLGTNTPQNPLTPYLNADPKLKIGIRGSTQTGVKGNPSKHGVWNPDNYDLDLFIISDDLAVASAGKIVKLPQIRDELVREFPELFQGLRLGGKGVSVKFYTEEQAVSKGGLIFYDGSK